LLSGNRCTASCPKISRDCPEKQRVNLFLTLGHIYFLFKTSQSHSLDEKDFNYGIHIGKPYVDEFEKENFTYKPMDDLDEQWQIDFKDPSFLSELDKIESKIESKIIETNNVTDLQLIREKVSKFVGKVSKDTIENSRKVFVELIEHGSDNVDKRYVRNQLHKLDNSSLRFDSKTFSGYREYISTYLKGIDTIITDQDIYSILEYLLIAYQPSNNNDFPHINFNRSKVQNLIRMTVNLDTEHPKKWTDARSDKITSTTNPYTKLIYFDDRLFIWFKFVKNEDLSSFSNLDIIVKKIIDHILFDICEFFFTSYMIFKLKEAILYDRFKRILNYIFEIMKKNPDKFVCLPQISHFLLDTQIDNQYILIKELDFDVDVKKKLNVIKPSPEMILKTLLTDNFIEKKKIV